MNIFNRFTMIIFRRAKQNAISEFPSLSSLTDIDKEREVPMDRSFRFHFHSFVSLRFFPSLEQWFHLDTPNYPFQDLTTPRRRRSSPSPPFITRMNQFGKKDFTGRKHSTNPTRSNVDVTRGTQRERERWMDLSRKQEDCYSCLCIENGKKLSSNQSKTLTDKNNINKNTSHLSLQTVDEDRTEKQICLLTHYQSKSLVFIIIIIRTDEKECSLFLSRTEGQRREETVDSIQLRNETKDWRRFFFFLLEI